MQIFESDWAFQEDAPRESRLAICELLNNEGDLVSR